jgi:putative heme-binding domain-containing protein
MRKSCIWRKAHNFMACRIHICMLLCLLFAAGSSFADESDLEPLVALIGQVDDAELQLQLLTGMHEGLRGRMQVDRPAGWPETYKKLANSENKAVCELARVLGFTFGDPASMKSMQDIVMNPKSVSDERCRMLKALAEKKVPSLVGSLHTLLTDSEMLIDDQLRTAALEGLAAYDHADTPRVILKIYPALNELEKNSALSTLASRPVYASALLSAVAVGKIERREISAYVARQIHSLGDDKVNKTLSEIWGEVRQTSTQKQALIAKYKNLLTPEKLAKADPRRGRLLYQKNCGKCHKMFDAGENIGPNLTGSNRANLDYILHNAVDPSSEIGKDYQLSVVVTVQGRVLNGIVRKRNDQRIVIQTPTEQLIVPLADIDEEKLSPLSMMPAGQLELLSETEVQDLIRYLASPAQVPLP